MDKEIENPKTGNKIKIKTALQLPDEHPANKKAKDMVAKSPTKDDDEPMVATPAPKGKSKKPMKNPFSKESPAYEPKQKEIDKEKEQHKAFIKKVGKTPQPADFDGDMDKYFDALNQHMKDVEAKLEKEKTNESTRRRFTVKEIRMWMKKLEENRYKKVYNSDARRVAWMVNNEGVELSEMPKSMSKKWTKAQYGRERYLATEFIKSKSEQMNERKLTEKVKYKKDKKIGGEWYTKQGTHKHQMKANIIAKREFGRYYDTEVVKEKGGYTIYVKPLKEGKLTSEQKLREQIRGIIKEQMNEAITGSDRKILFILVREIVRNLKSKIKNFDVNNKSHLNRVGSSILAIIRAMTYSPDNMNYKNFKKYFPKNFNSKLIQKKLKQFHSQNDKVQVTLVTQAIKNELGAGVNEEKLSEQKFKKVILPNDMKTKVKVSKMIKQLKLKIDKDYDVKALKARGGDQVISILPKHYNKFIELAMKNRLNPRG